MKVSFNTPKDIVTTPEQKVTISELTIIQMVDNPSQKVVSVMTQELGRIVLWKGSEYDSIGQWTDADVSAKIKALYP